MPANTTKYGAIAFSLEEERVVVRLPPRTSEAQLKAFIVDTLRRWPDYADRDWIYDDQGPVEDLTFEGMAVSAAAFNGARSGEVGTVSVIVSYDPNFAVWAAVMDLTFRGRRHLQALSVEDAHRRIDLFRSPSQARRAGASGA
jgi:hypothetical protein